MFLSNKHNIKPPYLIQAVFIQTILSQTALVTMLLVTSLLCHKVYAEEFSSHTSNNTKSNISASVTTFKSLVVTIKPLYSLVAHLTDGVIEPVLLLEQIPSVHHYNLRPSQRKQLANADMIIWVGPQMESYLTKILQQQSSNNTVIATASNADGLNRLTKRSLHSHDNSNEAESVDESSAISSEAHHNLDPHIWLSSENAIVISRHLSQLLIEYDPVNREIYEKNLSLLIDKIEATSILMKNSLSIPNREYIAYHDAYQYLENELGLTFIDSISFDENAGTSLKHAREISSIINKNKLKCLVFQAPKPAIVSTFQSQSAINATALDPLGLNTINKKNAWFELMQQLALNFNRCLSSETADD